MSREINIYGLKTLLIGLVVVVAIFVQGLPAVNAEYPEKPVSVIVPWGAGGGMDVPTRLLADYVSKQWNQQIQVVNKPGASGVTGTLEVIQSGPDGYTLLGDSSSTNSLQQATVRNLPYDIKDRTFIARSFVVPYVLVVKADSPWKTLKDVADAIKRDPENFRWGCIGPSGGITYVIHQFLYATGGDISRTKKVVFRGGPPGAAALAGGHIDFYAYAISGCLPYLQSKKLRAVGVPLPERLKQIPNVATTSEQGYPECDKTVWIGITGPKGLPANVVKRWDNVVRKAVKDPSFIERTDNIGTVPWYLDSDDFRKASLKEMEEAKRFYKSIAAQK